MDAVLNRRHHSSIQIQRTISLWNSLWFVPLTYLFIRVVFGYKCARIKEVHAKLETIFEELDGRPVIICSNHLTMIDSIILVCLFQPLRKYLWNSQALPWSVPEATNFRGNPVYRLICYLGKCVYIERKGSTASRKITWEKLKTLLRQGDMIGIFPEGGRSRTGRIVVEDCVYGVGEILQEVQESAVLCVYMRGESQKTYGYFPKFGDNFEIELKSMIPKTEKVGRRAHKDLTLQIMNQLKSMENEYFTSRE